MNDTDSKMVDAVQNADTAIETGSQTKSSGCIHPERPLLLRDLTEEEYEQMEKNLVRKIDRRLLPPLIIMYIMNYLDRYVYF